LADIRLIPGERPVVTTEPNVVVAPLPPGVYTFTVVVVDDVGNSTEASLRVTVR